jgi:tRNA-uridine 2-sulfurtransferase
VEQQVYRTGVFPGSSGYLPGIRTDASSPCRGRQTGQVRRLIGMPSALVCVSGGVDSTVSLLRCRERFSRVRAVHVQTRNASLPPEAVECCRQLGVELVLIPAVDIFNERVRKPSLQMLSMGSTPNPCAMCNSLVKLALPFSILDHEEILVTGHYASCSKGILARGLDRWKDQSYFLSLVPREILEKCWFPLEKSLKSDVFQEAIRSELPFISRESQDLCFPLSRTGIPGEIVDTEGNRVGVHEGLEGYTPGQRKGIGAHGERKYVVRLDRQKNTVVIGDRDSLYSRGFLLDSINWLGDPPGEVFDCEVQIRYRKPGVPGRITLRENFAEVVFRNPQRAVSPGQIGALYIGEVVLGGGLIADLEEE